ncbi:peptide/nickel transport system permease protein [Tepidamorphus gemmatus]|uniref:Peptide/nickel transport system permease protein n=1 Tax=Tepidamorphus gemmatus TaxID=747076 RepID=A0A4R3LXQ2_9HYPH|nr:ABC transporter permease [Tepidamorphus gemmatus]TCT05440.1 peptide/nickel transport system permease protein [Tepidamorphus gemmatus]
MADAAALREVVSRGIRSGSFVIGGTITALFVVVAIVAVFWTPWSYTAMNIAGRLQGPSMAHWLGTDQYGRDVLSMLMKGTHNSVLVAVVAVGIGMGLGVPLGALAAARRGWIDEVVMRASDFAFAFPFLLSAVMITALFGPGAVNSIIAIGIFNIPVFARLTRGSGMAVWQRDYVMAARAAGKGAVRITAEHILPNIGNVLIVQATIQFALAILGEAALSYLGLGTRPPQPSWGRMLNEAQTMAAIAPHLVIFPGLAIVLTVLGLNLFGDGLRDVLDPRLRRVR